jgi:hypothetical protein
MISLDNLPRPRVRRMRSAGAGTPALERGLRHDRPVRDLCRSAYFGLDARPNVSVAPGAEEKVSIVIRLDAHLRFPEPRRPHFRLSDDCRSGKTTTCVSKAGLCKQHPRCAVLLFYVHKHGRMVF